MKHLFYRINHGVEEEMDADEEVEEEQRARLVEWSRARGLPECVPRALLAQRYSLADVLQHAQREDIARLQLKYSSFFFVNRNAIEFRSDDSSIASVQ